MGDHGGTENAQSRGLNCELGYSSLRILYGSKINCGKINYQKPPEIPFEKWMDYYELLLFNTRISDIIIFPS